MLLGPAPDLDAKGADNRGIVLGDGSLVIRNSVLSCKGGDIVLGPRSKIGINCLVHSESRVEIAPDITIAAYCYLLAGGNHEFDRIDLPVLEQPSYHKGGVSIGARDQARIGQLLLDGGAHNGEEIIPRDWVRRMHEPCALAPFYGLLTWLNLDGRLFADASRASWFMIGAGGHLVWIDPDNEAVVVARWLDGAHSAGFVRRVAQAFGS